MLCDHVDGNSLEDVILVPTVRWDVRANIIHEKDVHDKCQNMIYISKRDTQAET